MENGIDHFENESSENNENMDIENEEHAEDNSHENNNIAEDSDEDIIFLVKIQFKYNGEELEKENVYKFLFNNNILKNEFICEICNHPMHLVNIKNRIDHSEYLGGS